MSSEALGSHPPCASQALLAQMKLFSPTWAFVSGYGAESRHQLPRLTVAGGQLPASSSAVLPPTREASLTVGIAEAGNFLFLPSKSRPPACGAALIGWPLIALTTA